MPCRRGGEGDAVPPVGLVSGSSRWTGTGEGGEYVGRQRQQQPLVIAANFRSEGRAKREDWVGEMEMQ